MHQCRLAFGEACLRAVEKVGAGILLEFFKHDLLEELADTVGDCYAPDFAYSWENWNLFVVVGFLGQHDYACLLDVVADRTIEPLLKSGPDVLDCLFILAKRDKTGGSKSVKAGGLDAESFACVDDFVFLNFNVILANDLCM